VALKDEYTTKIAKKKKKRKKESEKHENHVQGEKISEKI
jgi:hypothetical protein